MNYCWTTSLGYWNVEIISNSVFPLKNVLEFFYALLLLALFRKRIFKTCFLVNQSARLEASGWREKMQPQSGSSSSNLLLWGLSLSPGGTSVFYLQYWPTGHLLSQQTVIKFRVWYIFSFFRNRLRDDRWDQRSRKIFVDYVNFSVNNANCEQNLSHILRTYCDHCFQNSCAKWAMSGKIYTYCVSLCAPFTQSA